MANNPVISKIKLANGTVVDLKDAAARSDLATLLGSNAVKALGDAAWLGVDASLADNGTGVATSGVIKSYVDAQVGAINKFDVKVYEAKGGTGADKKEPKTAASADTMYILALVQDADAEAGTYVEFITVRSGAEGSYTYAWEKIGSTKADLTGYVEKTQKIAGIDLADDITDSELKTALGLGALAYKASASGKFTPAGNVAISSDAIKDGSVTLNDFTQTSTDASLTKGDYTPAGSVSTVAHSGDGNGAVMTDASISVTIKDASSATDVTDLTYDAYTPVGSVALSKDNESGTFQVSGTISKPNVTVNDNTKDTFVKSLKAGSVDAAAIDSSKFSGGSFTGASAASFTQGSKASFTQGSKASFSKGTAIAAATEGIVAAVGTGDDAETLIFTAAATDNVIGHDEATFTANGDDTFVANGDDSFTANNVGTFTAAAISDGFFTAQKLPVVDGTASAVTAVTAELAAAPTFTGDKFTPAFTGTSANIKLTGAKYLKQEINTATISNTYKDLSFSGTESKNILVTGVKYDKATANGATFTGTDASVSATFTGTEGDVSVQ